MGRGGEGESRQEASGHTHIHKLTTGLTGWSVVVDFKTSLSLKRRPHTAPLDTDPVLLIYYLQRKTLHCLSAPSPSAFHFNSFKQLSGRKTQDTTTCVHHNVPSKSEFHLDRKNTYIRMPWNSGCRLCDNQNERFAPKYRLFFSNTKSDVRFYNPSVRDISLGKNRKNFRKTILPQWCEKNVFQMYIWYEIL